MNKILSSSIKQVSQKKSKDRLQSSEICKAAIKLTSAIKPLNAYITVTSELAKKQAQDADERQSTGKSLGCLDGIPIAIKDNFCTNGQPTTCASQMLANFVPTYDATVYSRLKNSGAVLIGKTNLDQFAMGSGTIDSYYGPTKNIWGSDLMKNYTCESGKPITRNELPPQKDNWYIAGGSSGGSAIAVATGTCYAALGSDTGGSTRNPAAYCGLIGLKPTYGLVSRHGLIPLVNSMDVPGIITRTVDDAVLVLNAVAGPDPLDSTTLRNEFKPVKLRKYSSLRGIRIGIPMEYYTSEINLEVESCCLRLTQDLEEAGATIVLVSLPHTEYSIVCYSVLNQCEVASNMARYDGIEYGLRVDEMTSVKELYAKTRSQGFNDVVRSRILAGNFFLLSDNYDDYFIKAMKIRRLISQDFDAVWDSNIDLLLTPTTLSEIPLYSEYISADNQTQCSVYDYCTQPANMAGIPAVNVPVMLSKKGLPLSVQLMAPFLHEDRLLTVAKWIEEIAQFPRLTLKDASLLE